MRAERKESSPRSGGPADWRSIGPENASCPDNHIVRKLTVGRLAPRDRVSTPRATPHTLTPAGTLAVANVPILLLILILFSGIALILLVPAIKGMFTR